MANNPFYHNTPKGADFLVAQQSDAIQQQRLQVALEFRLKGWPHRPKKAWQKNSVHQKNGA
jgi:hypothetical protein